MFALRTVIVSILLGTGDHAARDRRARAPRDPRAADRRRPRGLVAARVAVRRALAQHWARHRARCDRPRSPPARRRRAQRQLRRPARSASASSGCSSASRCWRRSSSSRSPALVGWPAAPRRRRRRRAGRRQRRPQPGPHRVDRGRADDRAHARDAGRGARRRPERVDHVGDQRPAARRLRRRRQQRSCRSAPPRATSSPRVPGVTAASHVRADKALVAARRSTSPASTRRRSRSFYRFNWTHGSDRTLARSERTGRS